ncbi:TPA: GNAT family N-acetyltransferase [Salmonella enterica subsp. enterica serovar Paratyphi A]
MPGTEKTQHISLTTQVENRLKHQLSIGALKPGARLITKNIAQELGVSITARQLLGYPVLVSEENGVVTGYASFGDWRSFDGFRYTVEHSVYVHPAHQGKGLGRKLLSRLIDEARRCGKHVMVAGIESQNAASIRLHHSLGFTVTAQMPQVGVKFGRWLDLTFMQLQLDEHAAPDAC